MQVFLLSAVPPDVRNGFAFVFAPEERDVYRTRQLNKYSSLRRSETLAGTSITSRISSLVPHTRLLASGFLPDARNGLAFATEERDVYSPPITLNSSLRGAKLS